MRLDCISCDKTYSYDYKSFFCDCGDLLKVSFLKKPNLSKEQINARSTNFSSKCQSGVWRFKEWHLDLDESSICTRLEGNTNLYQSDLLSKYTRVANLRIKHEGENPSGSFKDRGMTTAISMAKLLGYKAVACASTGNTSASMASYAASCGLKAFVFIPDGKISFGKLSQSLAYGAHTLQIQGNFDDALTLVQDLCQKKGIYLLNSLNPYRIEGQKTIFFELMQQLNFEVPDWIILPGGNLGNVSALGKAAFELKEWGIIDKIPRFAVVQAKGANPFYLLMSTESDSLTPMIPETMASAIRIGNPVSWKKAQKVILNSNGYVTQVTEQEIMDAKTMVDRSGIGAEPASCCSIAGLKKLQSQGIIKTNESVVAILTGHVLKDPDNNVKIHTDVNSDLCNNAVKLSNDMGEIEGVIDGLLG
ncbi:MAG: threonine synthase [Candidatus Cloacimonadota bacterium]|nr:MAG: threonine synthase [Candidatus Cloacimonadota bacterium]